MMSAKGVVHVVRVLLTSFPLDRPEGSPGMSARSPSARFRTALATATSPSPSLSHLQRLADRLPSTSDGRPGLRNPDQAGVTSLHLAANRGRADVFGWLLDEGIEEEEVSRVRLRVAGSVCTRREYAVC